MNISKACLIPLVLGSFTAGIAFGQQKPQSTVKEPDIPSRVQTLNGQLVYHDGIRKWFELKLDRAQSGQASIQLVPAIADSKQIQVWKQIQVLRGCRVRSKGPIFLSPTGPHSSGYYSLEYTQSVQHIESVETCTLKPPIQVVPTGMPDKNVDDYQVDMGVNYSPGDHPVVFRVTSAGKELRPWQAYASYSLNGRSVLYGLCGGGFAIDKVFGTPQANPSHLTVGPGVNDDMAAFDLKGAASSGKADMHLGYTCVRKPSVPGE
jgi:hypothetical protein